jgi:hypothetical protein
VGKRGAGERCGLELNLDVVSLLGAHGRRFVGRFSRENAVGSNTEVTEVLEELNGVTFRKNQMPGIHSLPG